MKQILTFVLLCGMCFTSIYAQVVPEQHGIHLVTHNSGSKISFIDLPTGNTVGTVPTDEGPYEITLAPDGKTAMVTNYGLADFGSTLTVIDVINRTALRTIKLPAFAHPHGIAFLPDGERVIVTMEDYNSVAVVNVHSGEIVKQIETGQEMGHLLTVDHLGKLAYVSNINSGTVTVIDLQSLEVVQHIEVGRGPEGIDVSPDGNEVWVANRYDNTISIISTDNFKVSRTIKAGHFPTRIKFTPDGRYVLVTMPRWGEVFLFDAAKKKFLTYFVPDIDIEEYEQQDKISVHGNSVAVKRMDTANRKERIERLKKRIGPMPSEIYVSPDGRYAYITSRNSDLIAVLLLNSIELPELHSFIKSSDTPDGMVLLSPRTMVTETASQGLATGYDDPLDDFRPEVRYFRELDEVDSLDFVQKYEYPFLLVLSEHEKQTYEKNDTINRKKSFIARYIKSKNRNPLYSVNYWFLEFISRCSFAADNFAIEEPPYFDIRGEYYIRYGKPGMRFTDKGGAKRSKILTTTVTFTIITFQERPVDQQLVNMYETGKPETQFMVYPNETWNYDENGQNLTFHFACKKGTWQKIETLEEALRTHDRRKKNLTWQWMELVKERPQVSRYYNAAAGDILTFEQNMMESSVIIDRTIGGQQGVIIQMPETASLGYFSSMEPHLQMMRVEENVAHQEFDLIEGINDNNIESRFDNVNLLPLDYDIAQFKANEGKTRIELVAYSDIEGIEETRLTPDPSDTMHIEYRYVARDQNFSETFSGESMHTFSQAAARNNSVQYSMTVQSAETDPFSGDFTMQVKDLYSDNAGFMQDSVLIRDFSGDDLMLSDVQFYNPVSEPQKSGLISVVNIESIDAVPIVSNRISKNSPVLCYFEIYNLQKAGVRALYEINFSLKRIESARRLRRFIDRITGSDQHSLSVTSSRQVTANDMKELLSVDLAEIDPGDYAVEITVINPENETAKTQITRAIKVIE